MGGIFTAGRWSYRTGRLEGRGVRQRDHVHFHFFPGKYEAPLLLPSSRKSTHKPSNYKAKKENQWPGGPHKGSSGSCPHARHVSPGAQSAWPRPGGSQVKGSHLLPAINPCLQCQADLTGVIRQGWAIALCLSGGIGSMLPARVTGKGWQ